MTDLRRFEKLISKCEALAERSPNSYRFRVAILAILGVCAALLALSVAIGLVAGVATLAFIGKQPLVLKFAALPLAVAYILFRALWLRIPSPNGHVVTAATAPRLFAEIATVRDKVGSLKVHRTVIDPEGFNAGVVQIPRLGPLGWPRCHLIIGLPLLEALTTEQFRAVLGHELGHLSRNQTRFRNWIYRTRHMWARISDEISARGGLSASLIVPFIRWYGPYFNGYSFVLARANEYDADRAASAVAGADAIGDALTSIAVKSHFIEHTFWQELRKRAAREASPPKEPFRDYLRLARDLPPAEIQAGMLRALTARTSHADTHPCLTDRLRALRVEPREPVPVQVSAGEALLGPLRNELIASTNANWVSKFTAQWQQAHENGKAQLAEHEALVAKVDTLDPKSMVGLAYLTEHLFDETQARPWLDRALQTQPDLAPALLMRGRMRLVAGDDSGAQDIEEAMRLAPETMEVCSQILFSHYSSRRDTTRTQKVLDNLLEIEKKRELARVERDNVSTSDIFVPHGLSQEACQPFSVACHGQRRVKRAWLVRHLVQHFPDDPHYVLLVDYGWLRKATLAELKIIVENLPDVSRLVIVKRRNKRVARKIVAVEGSMIYERNG